MTKYTFLLPAFKAKYLRQAIDSILAQTYKDFNVLVSDDCSPENLKTIVDSYDDSRITYRCNEKNIGGKDLVDHWNLLVNICDSEYLIMASDDDIYEPTFLEEIDNLTRMYPDVNLFRARVQRIDNEDNVTSKEDIFDEYQTEIETVHSIFCGNYIGCIGNYVFKTKPLKQIDGFVNLPYAWFSDMLTAIAMAKHGQANTSKTHFYFRLSESNISNTARNRSMEQQKLQATIYFDRWMSNYVASIDDDGTKLSKNQLDDIKSAFKHRVYSQCGDYSWSVSVFKWKSIYESLQQNNFFSRNSFLKHFGISVINRKLG